MTGQSQRGISVEGVAKRFGATVSVLDGVDLEIGERESVCILGPSGCGKTTLLRAMAGLISLDRGRVVIDGERVSGPSRKVAMVFQQFGLMPWKTVAQNVAYGIELAGLPRSEVRSRVAAYIGKVGLEGFERSYPYQLSGGMQQRVGLARALAVEPAILLMDEPFGALDALTREVLQDEVLRIWEATPRAMVFITHSIEEAIALGDRVVVLGPRPARIRAIIDVAIDRPRTVASVIAHPGFVGLREQCWQLLRQPAAA